MRRRDRASRRVGHRLLAVTNADHRQIIRGFLLQLSKYTGVSTAGGCRGSDCCGSTEGIDEKPFHHDTSGIYRANTLGPDGSRVSPPKSGLQRWHSAVAFFAESDPIRKSLTSLGELLKRPLLISAGGSPPGRLHATPQIRHLRGAFAGRFV